MVSKLFKKIINRDALDVFLGYLDLASPQEIRYDFFFSLTFASLLIGISSFADNGIQSMLDFFNAHVGSVITALSILAGFNVTSIAIIATSQSEVSQYLRNNKIEGKNATLLEQIISFFCWAIMVQLLALLLSIIAIFIFKFLFPMENRIIWDTKYFNFTCLNLIWIILFFGAWFVAYSITLTVRNVSILYYYLVADSRK